ncbi:hypothetical protein [Sulfurovum sp.]|uniref:hypothetical protein n=1 Tax=Sulfurovum sp. TaxID=1969726 RepID=UPI00356662CC
MNENKNAPEEMIRNVEDETSEMIEEIIEEMDKEVSEIEEEIIDEMEDEVSQTIEEEGEHVEETVEDPPLPANMKKHIKAKHLVEKAKKIVNEANNRIDACKLLLESNLQEYVDAKAELKKGGFDACVLLVNQLGQQTKEDEEEKTTPIFEPKEDVKPMVLKDVSSGKFSGFIYALFGGVAAAIGMIYLATEKLEMTLNVTKVPSEDVMQSILAWFSTIIGMQENVTIGAGVLGSVVLVVMILIYIIRVSLKARSNLHFAVKQFVEAELYTEQKANCKQEMDKVDAHIKDAIGTMKTYEVLLNEQKGKLQRILYIEGNKEKSAGYHDKSYLEIRDTKELIRSIKEFLDISMSEEGKLSAKSVLFLQQAKDQMDKMLKRYY